MSELYKLVYTSTRDLDCTEQEVQHILEQSRTNNKKKDITGILLQTKHRFVQYLEGNKNAIYSLYDRIKVDPRHHHVLLRYFSPIEERLFPSWQMGYKDLDSHSLLLYGSISLEDQQRFRDLVTQPHYEEEEGLRVLKLFFNLV